MALRGRGILVIRGVRHVAGRRSRDWSADPAAHASTSADNRRSCTPQRGVGHDIQASRAEKRASITAVRVMGKLAGLDAIDGTPVVDIKPWLRELGPRGEVHQPAWVDALMAGYWG